MTTRLVLGHRLMDRIAYYLNRGEPIEGQPRRGRNDTLGSYTFSNVSLPRAVLSRNVCGDLCNEAITV